MSKILFLCMSCRDEKYAKYNELVKSTWGKNILDNKYPNCQLMFYDGWDNDTCLDLDNHILHVHCEDTLENTYKKTYYALSYINKNIEYDYIFRTNCTTYINVSLIIKLIEYIEENNQQDILWVPELISLVEANVPFPLTIYGRGNGLIFSRKLINILLFEGISHLYDEIVDDVIIGNILNTYWIKNNQNYLDHIKSYSFGWFKVTPENDYTNGHQLCDYSNTNKDFNFCRNFGIIQVKAYHNFRDTIDNYIELHESLKDKIDNEIDDTLRFILEYSKNPSIFIGSVLGYIDMEVWLQIDKHKLWEIECTYKAFDDINKDKFFGKKFY